MKIFNQAWFAMSAVVFIAGVDWASAAPLADATFDTDSYAFVGTNNQFDAGVSIGTDYSAGVVHTDNAHINFGLIRFDGLSGVDTVANGGPDKYLVLEVHNFPGAATVAFSVAAEDIDSNTNEYPSFFFPGNPAGGDVDRLQWYMDNIKGDDARFGGYAGGAAHIGVLEVNGASKFSIDVTSVVDAWIDGSTPNYGFGVWGVAVGGGLGDTFDFASSDNPLGNGPYLSSVPVPEPGSIAMAILLSFSGLAAFLRKQWD